MSILIKGMEMPTNCHECELVDILPTCPCGKMADEDFWNNVSLAVEGHKDCPLVEVPPHGDLIDRNKLYKKTAEWEAQALHMVEVTMHDEDTTEWRKWSTVLTERSAFKFDVADAPTIIEAEEGET